ncbi:hypothetical protein CSAL01_01075 [Colletotrichum salicis]|uniref:Uncharacterized protein n=1 Tax=Colletotrichum salicis TaxID=1209931 RepID=A0A135T085_9PEZI|nr:hypothetical protein CSAL01_01075 [Colletotrichum salicis]
MGEKPDTTQSLLEFSLPHTPRSLSFSAWGLPDRLCLAFESSRAIVSTEKRNQEQDVKRHQDSSTADQVLYLFLIKSRKDLALSGSKQQQAPEVTNFLITPPLGCRDSSDIRL